MDDLKIRAEGMDAGLDLSAYRDTPRERERIRELFGMVPPRGRNALDIGARDGFLSLRLAERFESVTALDLTAPRIDHPLVECVSGDAGNLAFADSSFDLVLCAEVLEHIPPARLRRVCAELARVTARHLLIRVPYEQDTRMGRTLCRVCGGRNPPWGHVNVFDEDRLEYLFPGLTPVSVRYVGKTRDRTTALAAWLDDRAGNPYGTYDQDEVCVHCSGRLCRPAPPKSLGRRLCAAGAHWLNRAQRALARPRPMWIHILYSKPI